MASGRLDWQIVLITDTEDEIKLTIFKDVRRGVPYAETNKKVTSLIAFCIKELESAALKETVAQTYPLYATRLYYQFTTIYGTRASGAVLLDVYANAGINVPETVQTKLLSLSNLAYNYATPNRAYDLDYERQVMDLTKKLLNTTPKVDYNEYSSVRAHAERQLRWEWQQKNFDEIKASGIRLVWIDAHANCSKRCEPWQGKLYSLYHESGEIDGIRYQPIENATDQYYTTKAGKVWKNGCLSGFNCRHTTRPYVKGNKPEHIPAEVISRVRKVETTQRAMEREIRKNALFAKAFNNKKYKAEVKRLTAEYEKYSRDNGMAYYPSRLKV